MHAGAARTPVFSGNLTPLMPGCFAALTTRPAQQICDLQRRNYAQGSAILTHVTLIFLISTFSPSIVPHMARLSASSRPADCIILRRFA